MSTKRRQKNLTVMFTDISGFTRHTETISREDLMSRLDTHNELLMPIIAHFDGEIVKTIGDAFLITFESPTNAVQCGLFMQHTLRKYNADRPEGNQIHIKVSINSGEVTVTDTDVFGDPVNVAAKIEKATNPDEIYFTESVFLAMNKAEVPTSFVKNFRPKGADSTEIKLYKVAMDEGDERYQKIISGTNIDAEENKTKVIELSNTAEKEFIRYQDTLDALVESQGKSSRGVIVAVIVAAIILGGAIIGGFALFGGSGESEESKTIESARLFLSNDKPEDARELLLNFASKNGNSEAIEDALEEVDSYIINKTIRDADELLDVGRPERALTIINNALGDTEPNDTLQGLIDRVEAYVSAREHLAAGETDRARKDIELAAGTGGMTKDMKLLIGRADAIDSARAIVNDEKKLKSQANTAIEVLAEAWGDDINKPAVKDLMARALKSRLYWEARSRSYKEGQQLLEQYSNRFPAVGDWSRIEWEVDLGGYWNYVTDPELDSQWHDFFSKEWKNHRDRIRDAAEQDPEFAFRAAEDIVAINEAKHVLISSGQTELQLALEARPDFKETRRGRIIELLRRFLTADLDEESYARKLMRTDFYEDIKPDLEEGLFAVFTGWNEDSPNITTRQNAYAVLADRADLAAIEDPFGYFRDHFDMFMDSNYANPRGTPVLTRAQIARLFQQDISADDYMEFVRFLTTHEEDIAAKRGKYSVYTYAPQMVGDMLEDLRKAHPEYSHLEE